MYNFLEELIFLLDSENFIVRKATVKIFENKTGVPAHSPHRPNPRPPAPTTKLDATIYGDDVKNYSGLEHVKAATYAEMHVKKTKNGWEVQAVLDV
mgnify:FL=1